MHWLPADKLTHLNVGVVIFLLAAALFRKPLSSPLPMIAVLICEIGNEIMDVLATGHFNKGDTLGDFIATLFWPVILAVFSYAMTERRRAI